MATRRVGTARLTAVVASATAPSEDMVFESAALQPIPAGVVQIVFKIAQVGADQSVSLGARLIEQLTPTSDWIIIDTAKIDNLPSTPEASFMTFMPKAGARYAITFMGEMHALTLGNGPLELELVLTADGVGAPLETFGGKRSIDARFCVVRGIALLGTRA